MKKMKHALNIEKCTKQKKLQGQNECAQETIFFSKNMKCGNPGFIVDFWNVVFFTGKNNLQPSITYCLVYMV